ncbi:MAG TPA: bestrophin family ion channel [Oculatellaceae cyanobacterium]|jgi:putative membrane protein
MFQQLHRFKNIFLKVLSNPLKRLPFKPLSSNAMFNNRGRSFIGKYHLYSGEKLHWVPIIFRLLKAIIPNILSWVIFCGFYGFLISLLYSLNCPVALPDESGFVTQAVLSFNIGLTLLLVFRTNTAHERFWEGRKLWGYLVNVSRNLARDIWIVVKEKDHKDREEKEAILRLIIAFPVAMKLHLRAEPVNQQLAYLMPETQYLRIRDTQHPPLQIAFWISDYLQYQNEINRLNIYQLTGLHRLVDELVDILGGCERILKTPLPLIYTILLRKLVLVYCLVLPFEIVKDLHWWTGVLTAFVSFTLLSIEQIGSEIEEPFGHDPNDLPLDVICTTIRRNIEELIALAPISTRSQR